MASSRRFILTLDRGVENDKAVADLIDSAPSGCGVSVARWFIKLGYACAQRDGGIMPEDKREVPHGDGAH